VRTPVLGVALLEWALAASRLRFVAKVAQKRRVDVVMVAAPNMLYVRNKADITDDVIAVGKSFFEKEMPLIDPALNGGKPASLNK
jgi:hypothetical protein